MPSAPAAAESFRSHVRRAVIWRSGTQVLGQLIAWGSTFLVIRLLTPADYGLVAMTGVLLLLLNMLNGYGLANALIQHGEVADRQMRQVFGMLLLLNLSLAALQLLLAPLVAAFYGEPRVATLLRVQAILYLPTPLASLGYALLARRMDFAKQARVNLIASVAGALAALAGAYGGLGVWTLVLAPAVMFFVRAIGLASAAGAWMWPSFDFRGSAALARYGGVVAASGLLGFAASQADVLIAGRWFDAHQVGIYTTSLFLTQIFTNKFVPPLNEVAFSAYARLRREEGQVAPAFASGCRLVMLAALPFYLGVAVTAEPLVQVMLGERWLEAVPVVRVLALAMPFMALQTLFPPAVDAVGRPEVTARANAIGAVLLPASFLIGVTWGLPGLAAAWVIAHPVLLALVARRALPVIGLSARELAQAVVPAAGAAIAMAVLVLLVDRGLPPLPPLARLATLGIVGAAGYFGWLLVFARPMLREAIRLIRR